MHRAQPVASTVCDEKWRDRSYRIHRQKLQKMKPSVDNKSPTMYPHLYQKLKKAQMEEERCSEIERDNRTLVKRMTQIMQRSSIDSRNPVQYKSLNRDQRRRELIRITQENQALLKRIQTKQPVYNHLVWEQEREKNEALCERICKYPFQSTSPVADEDGENGMYEYYAASKGTPSAAAADRPLKSPAVAAAAPAASSTRGSISAAESEKEASKSKNSVMSQSQKSAASTASPKSSKDEEEDDDDEAASSTKNSSKRQDDLDVSKASKASDASDADASDNDEDADKEEDDKEDEDKEED